MQSAKNCLRHLRRYHGGSIAVIGGGQMASGIAICSALAAVKHYESPSVMLVDPHGSASKCRSQFGAFVKREAKNPEDAEKLLECVSFHTNMNTPRWADVKFVIEAVKEDLEVKRGIFTHVSEQLCDDAILASNTSSITITKLAGMTNMPERVIGMHFMNPAPLMKLVEVVRGLQTSDSTVEATKTLAEEMSKVCVEAKDSPGFVSNRVLMPYINEATFALQEGIASVEGIDKIMTLATKVPMGPLRLADFIGLDTCLYVLQNLLVEFGDPKYRPSSVLKQMVDSGRLGKKVGVGFYRYS